MTGRNKTPLIGWHPASADLVAWFEAEVERRGGGRGVRSAILDEALEAYRAVVDARTADTPAQGAADTPAQGAES